jgi:hypothetical protein
VLSRFEVISKGMKIKLKLFTSCMAIIKTVFRLNFLSHKSNKSSKLGPSNSNTRALYLLHGPK